MSDADRPDPASRGAAVAASLDDRLPADVLHLLAVLEGAGRDAFVVGGSVRDLLLGREPLDWDLTTDADPRLLGDLFPGSRYENRYGTVTVTRGGTEYEITTYRTERAYDDHRRPTEVAFGATLEEDLARRDFTVNAMAYGRAAADAPAGRAAGDAPAGRNAGRAARRLVDPHGGRGDLDARTIRAVGDADARFGEDALRMLRAVRLASVLGFGIDPATRSAIERHAADLAHLSGTRVGAEVERLLLAPVPSVGLRLLESTGLLAVAIPELAAQRGIPQAKIAGDDLWDHTVRTVDAAATMRPPDPERGARPSGARGPTPPPEGVAAEGADVAVADSEGADAEVAGRRALVARAAALLHDVGKPATFADGRFHRHESVGAPMADAVLGRLAFPRDVRERVTRLVRHHMFSYEPTWSDAAVRRFIRRIGEDLLDDLLDLRSADDVGSGLPAAAPRTTELRRRCREQLDARVPLGRGDLAVDGDDVARALGIAPGPRLGRILDRLTDRVVDDPALNDRTTLLALARAIERNLEGR
jgi:putative nucleotidyltransferase with HDIG domain